MRRIIASLPATAGSASSRQKYEVAVGKSRLLLALNVSYLCRDRRSETSARNVRFGSLADVFTNISLMSAFGGKADVKNAGNT